MKTYLTSYDNNGREWCGPDIQAESFTVAKNLMNNIKPLYKNIRIDGELIEEIPVSEEYINFIKNILCRN